MRSYVLACFGLLLFLAGFAGGRFVAYPKQAMALVPDTRPLVSTVIIEGMHEGRVEGFVRGETRFFLGDEQVFAESDGSFSVDGSLLFQNRKNVLVPVWAKFVASKKGKRYYPVFSKQGSNLKVTNRVYFRSKADAEAAGYR